MIITMAKPLKKRLTLLYTDGEPAVKIDTEVFSLSGYKEGDSITDEELRELIERSETRRANEKALYLLEYRSRSKKELTDKMIRSSISREAAQNAASRMEELGLVDDESYAEDLARVLFETKKYGAYRVKQELLQKGISRDIIDGILEKYSSQDTAQRINDILRAKYPGWNGDEKTRRRAFAALQRMGYSVYDIRQAAAFEAESEEYY